MGCRGCEAKGARSSNNQAIGRIDAAGHARPLAEADILEIWDYIAEDSIAAADDWVDRLDEKFRLPLGSWS